MKLSERFQHRPGRARPRPVRVGLIALAVLGVVLYMGYTSTNPLSGGKGDLIRAEFRDATHLRANTDVRVAGVNVGKVEEVELSDDTSRAVVKLRMNSDSGVTLHRDARAAVWWRTLLGRNTYVEIEPGSPSAGELGEGTIPLGRTTVQEELDAVVSALPPEQRQATRQIIGGFDEGFSDTAGGRRTIDALDGAGPSLARGLRGLRGTEAGDLPKLVREMSKTLGIFGRNVVELAGFIDNGRIALGTMSANSPAISRLVREAPAALADTRLTLTRVEKTLDDLDPLAVKLVPGARKLDPAARAATPMLRRLDTVLKDATPTLRDLRPAVRRLAAMAPTGRKVLTDLDPTIARLNDELLPWLDEGDPETKMRNYQAIGPFFSATNSMGSPFDANGNVLNFQTFVDERSLLTLGCITRLTDPTATITQKLDCRGLEAIVRRMLSGQAPPGAGEFDPALDEDVGDRSRAAGLARKGAR
ncbi:MAG: MlaD family protein [Solirubrobacteraceae bacterium]|nr:MlaD family protein [Solirubrobacteraceae bacterium]